MTPTNGHGLCCLCYLCSHHSRTPTLTVRLLAIRGQPPDPSAGPKHDASRSGIRGQSPHCHLRPSAEAVSRPPHTPAEAGLVPASAGAKRQGESG
jgi:hypothetical protein